MRSRLPRSEAGSALLLVLLVMLLVSSLALSLTYVTGLEMQMGGTEKVITNNFYMAESGVHAALGAVMVTNDWGGEAFASVEGPAVDGFFTGHRVVTSRVQGIGPPQSPPLTIANEGEAIYHSFSVILTSTAQRVSWPDEETAPIYDDEDPRELDVTVQAQTTETVRYLLSPLRTPSTASEIYSAEDRVTVN